MSANFYAWLPSLPLDPAAKSFGDDVEALYAKAEAPHPKLLEFVGALLERHPDLDGSNNTCWAAGPLRDEILGGFINVAVAWRQADEAWAFFRQTAHAHGLVCYDPQMGRFYPP
jgi:hypothetical protein